MSFSDYRNVLTEISDNVFTRNNEMGLCLFKGNGTDDTAP